MAATASLDAWELLKSVLSDRPAFQQVRVDRSAGVVTGFVADKATRHDLTITVTAVGQGWTVKLSDRYSANSSVLVFIGGVHGEEYGQVW